MSRSTLANGASFYVYVLGRLAFRFTYWMFALGAIYYRELKESHVPR